ncbi:MAG: 50S ribosomal protein L18 [Candidatus Dasytiphilus stammeri]
MNKKLSRMRRAKRARCKLKKLNVIRLVIYRTPRHIYAQIIASQNSKILVTASTLEKDIQKECKYTGNKIAASIVGRIVAQRAIERGIKIVSLDRSGFLYHGRIKSLADKAREVGLDF